MTAEEFERASRDAKFVVAGVEKRILYPDGSLGFVLAHLRYSPDARAILDAARREQLRLVEENVRIGNELAHVAHSRMDGTTENSFDGHPETLVRTTQINPAIVDITLPAPHVFHSVKVCTGSMDVGLRARLFPENGGPELVFERTYSRLPMNPCVELPLLAEITARRVRLEISDPHRDELGEIHIREIAFR